jgi:preprotein translocase subunit SecF
MFVVTYRKLFFALSATLIAISVLAMIFFGFNFGIDFKGGTLTQVSYAAGKPAQSDLEAAITALHFPDFSDVSVQPTGANAYIIESRQLTDAEKTSFLAALSINSQYPTTLDSYNSVGPVIGAELKNKSITAMIVVVICIVLFVTYAFRKVSEPVPSWKFGLATIIALAHDIIIPTGFYIIYIHFSGGEIDILFVSALLTILGYSVHDTIVVFDRIREHLRVNIEERKKEDFETTVGKSVSETFGRSINTSFTIFLVLLALFFVGGSTTKDFALILLIGVIVGTYSSIFVASPLLVVFERRQEYNKKLEKKS